MSEHGYLTLGAAANPFLGERYNFDKGFSSFQGVFRKKDVKPKGRDYVDWMLREVDAKWSNDEPLFIQLTLLDPHMPYNSTPEETARFAADPVPNSVKAYRPGLRRLDDALSQLEQGLQERGLHQENTLWVIVADHGEGLHYPTHYSGSHGRTFTPGIAHVPWILRGPGIAKGHRVAGLASHVDILPTVLDFLAISIDQPTPGTSWAQQIRGAAAQTSRESAFIDTWYNEV
jgi:arylsulfatase A-like enzyme